MNQSVPYPDWVWRQRPHYAADCSCGKTLRARTPEELGELLDKHRQEHPQEVKNDTD